MANSGGTSWKEKTSLPRKKRASTSDKAVAEKKSPVMSTTTHLKAEKEIRTWLVTIGLSSWADTIMNELGYNQLSDLLFLANQKDDLKELLYELEQRGMKLAQKQSLRRNIINSSSKNTAKQKKKKRLSDTTRSRKGAQTMAFGIKIPGSNSSDEGDVRWSTHNTRGKVIKGESMKGPLLTSSSSAEEDAPT
eukprot:CAMPEP_0206368978 /NCGR_PEP_ID=MMETSP0294-20121207/5015_1 /ASSEMBLY_ACC=CAM_ASM_000327 /TAXON_ID=39354 /ORGANISM="Heterosigma akashiwo, Strain CCMP2393" /LENGTH=191 /DNA_ID=CAMNT_0053815629 /DNA_START=84 /DNA_END=655 /DNA_ORIENTATION=+